MKIAIVTGASSGMGRETAVQLADRFAGFGEIWLVARREERLSQLEEILPVPVRKFAIDLTDREQLAELETALQNEQPDVKILVNASGYGKMGRVGSVSTEEETGMVPYGASLYEQKQQNYTVCIFGLFPSAAGLCHLCGDKILCFKLQPGAGGRIERPGNLRYGRLPRSG